MISPGADGRRHPALTRLPEWPSGSIGVLATIDHGPYAIPVSAPVRAGDRRIMITLERTRGSLARLCREPEVALVLLTEGNVAFTARGRAAVVAEQLNADPDFVGVAIEVERIDDHRSHAFAVDSGIRRRWLNADAEHDLGACIEELRELAHFKPGEPTITKGDSSMSSISFTQRTDGGGAPEPIVGNRGAPILGPRNAPIESANPDLLISPTTDAGTMPNLKFSFAAARNRVLTGGWAREVTVRELPVATELAGVNMRLKPGGIREMHWHKEAEWSYMLAGRARITAVDADGRTFIDDVGEGDLWYFPAGIPHSIQGLEEGCEFLLVFDDGNFSENQTFLLTDLFVHLPGEVLSHNFGVPEARFSNLPVDVEHTRYIFAGKVPGPIASDVVESPAGTVPQTFSHHMLAQEPIRGPGGQARITDSTNFPVSKTIAAARVEVEPGAMREIHWHPTADEWQYYLSGRGRMTVFASSGTARTFDYQAGDVGVVPFAMAHYVENTGEETLCFLEMFRSDHFADVSLNQWMALSPPELVQAHLNLDEQTMAMLSKDKQLVVR